LIVSDDYSQDAANLNLISVAQLNSLKVLFLLSIKQLILFALEAQVSVCRSPTLGT
jgi:hypothetical protein